MPVTGFFTPPSADRYALRRVHVPKNLLTDAAPGPLGHDDLVLCDVLVDSGKIADVAKAGALDPALGPDLDKSLVLPGMLDAHAHLDKGHIVYRARNMTGDLTGAAAASGPDRATRWVAEDVRRRLEFGIRTAYAKGVVAIRTHLDSLAPQPDITFPVLKELRAKWAARSTCSPRPSWRSTSSSTSAARGLPTWWPTWAAIFGSGTKFMMPVSRLVPPEFDQAMENVFKLAEDRGLDLDLHVDESSDPEARTLIRIARMAVKRGFKGRILAGHCCALALQTDEFIQETMDACKDAGIDIVSLPAVNLYLQARGPLAGNAGRNTPGWRGVTLLHELKGHGLKVAIGGDNVRDPFYAYGDHDMLESFTQAVKIAQLDHPSATGSRPRRRSRPRSCNSATEMAAGRGRSADLIVLKARDYGEMLSRFQSDRVVIRGGRAIDTTLPDYRELDDIVRVPASV